MTGAIIGDLAAWTYENDKQAFYDFLVSDKAQLSGMGNKLIYSAEELMEKGNNIKTHNSIYLHDQMFVRTIAASWLLENEDRSLEFVQDYAPWREDDEYYARGYLSQMIYKLRHGATKDEAKKVVWVVPFTVLLNDELIMRKENPMATLVRAWSAFEDAFDYGSAIHNAMQLPGDRHMNAIVVGALAGAMYGNILYIKKKKYCGTSQSSMQIEKALGKNYELFSKLIGFEKRHRTFFPKNHAHTNVELHEWKPFHNAVENQPFNKDTYNKMLLAFWPDFDHRYGGYLDNGWFYIYRSGFVLLRFKIEKSGGHYYFKSLQMSEQMKDDPKGFYPLSEFFHACELDELMAACEK